MIDDIVVLSDSAVCARLLDKRIICNQSGGHQAAELLQQTPSVVCGETGACQHVAVDVELLLTREVGRGALMADSLSHAYKMCARPANGSGLICWGGANLQASGESVFEQSTCEDVACDALCEEDEPANGCWGQWEFTAGQVEEFDGVCGRFQDGSILCPGAPELEQLAGLLVDEHGSLGSLRGFDYGVCALTDSGSVVCKATPDLLEESGPAVQLTDGDVFSEFVAQHPNSVCARRQIDGKVVCAGDHPLLTEAESQACRMNPSSCPVVVTEESLSQLTTNDVAVCGLNESGRAVCYFRDSVAVSAAMDPFGYGQRLGAEGELLSEQVVCAEGKCVSAEAYSQFEITSQLEHGVDFPTPWAGCGITLDSRPHCFGMYLGAGGPSCTWVVDGACKGRIF